MILLDTNVLSALMQSTPDSVVVEWLDHQPADSIWLTSVTIFETRFGLALLPRGRRRAQLELSFDRLLENDLANRVVDFDAPAAATAAQLAADRRRKGRTVDVRDTLIAGMALARRATIATRNTRDSSRTLTCQSSTRGPHGGGSTDGSIVGVTARHRSPAGQTPSSRFSAARTRTTSGRPPPRRVACPPP